ncbi:hypothetical protein GPJ56_008679 [Histomonas meleagridis]|uniref:uncharacterized protein n=1 Tax=Histomonas meleagridis TaxID=135588 RepID=UPI003559BDDE|nr:hypothetical protein GPJ56_008679 [Histomonas meleagridis]KAH0805743.1 hypothetical protein GO595_001382 [Histomonas meleagridis]
MYENDSSVKLEATEKLLKQREIDCKEYQQRIQELEHIVQNYEKNEPEVGEFKDDQITYLQNKLNSAMEHIEYLQQRYLKVNAKRHSIQQKFLLFKNSTQPQRQNSQIEEENIKLETDIHKLKQSNDENTKIINELKSNLDQQISENQRLRQVALEKFDILQQKLRNARDDNPTDLQKLKNEIFSKDKEIESLVTTIQSLEESMHMVKETNDEFIQSIGLILGRDSLEGIVERIKELSPLQVENSKLKAQIQEMQMQGNINQDEAYMAIVDSLKKVRDNIDPNVLHLKPDSSLRQFFASFYNLINAALKSNASQTILLPHVRAVVWEARAFSTDSKPSSFADNVQRKPPPIDEPPAKSMI